MGRTNYYCIRELASLYGVQTNYYDFEGRRRWASSEALLPVLRALGAAAESPEDIHDALRHRQQELWNRPGRPVTVAWDGIPADQQLRMKSTATNRSVKCTLRLETGETRSWTCRPEQMPTLQTREVEGVGYVSKKLTIPGVLPWGYHRLTLELGGRPFETTIISTPLKAHHAPGTVAVRCWGVFLPLYALRLQGGWGCGDFSDLEALIEWVASLGGEVVATLPFLAGFLDELFEPSPYVPVSRLFWNELFVDVTRAPELEQSTSAKALLDSKEFQAELEALRSDRLVDYRRLFALKRKALEELARRFFRGRSEKHASFNRFVKSHPALEDYARFRATCERLRSPWTQWPERLREGLLRQGDYDEEAKRYHMYAQWLAHQQLESVSARAGGRGLRLYFDLPLGTNPSGYDVWRKRELFTRDISAGAPPDAFFTNGQEWGFPPLHPLKIREQGYEYVTSCLRHLMRYAGVLRVDHIMGLHRLFWIPKGFEPRQGVYVRYPAEELYALLTLESHRQQVLLRG